jgi:hypothetical protein
MGSSATRVCENDRLLTKLREENAEQAATIAALRELRAAERRRALDEAERRKDAKNRLREANRLLRTVKKRERVAMRRLQAARRRADAATRRADAQRELTEAARQLFTGEYYCPMERLWIIGGARYNEAHMFEVMRRETAPKRKERGQVGASNSYKATSHEAIRHRCAGGVGSVNKEEEEEKWPNDIFGTPNFAGEMASLVPVSFDRASTYADVARCVFGLPDDSPEDIQQVIHGSQNDEGVRIPGTGIKHAGVNKIRIWCQAEFFSQDPCVVIVPIMTLKEMRDWDHGKYSAIVLAGTSKTTTAAQAYLGIQLTQLGTLATTKEIEIARKSLEQVVQGLAYSLEHRQVQRQESLLETSMQRLLESFRSGLHADAVDEVKVPKESCESNLRVRKVTFQAHAAHFRLHAWHIAPDPLLLVIKAAINWSWLHGQQLLVTGEPPEDENDALPGE